MLIPPFIFCINGGDDQRVGLAPAAKEGRLTGRVDAATSRPALGRERPPAARRAYFDRALARLLPARSAAPTRYAAALAQRNGVTLPWTTRDRWTDTNEKFIGQRPTEVVWSAVSSTDATQAVIILALQGTVSNAATEGRPQARQHRLQLDIVLEDGQWMVRDLQWVNTL